MYYVIYTQAMKYFPPLLPIEVYFFANKTQLFSLYICDICRVAAHLRTFSKECGSFVHTIFPGERIHLRT